MGLESLAGRFAHPAKLVHSNWSLTYTLDNNDRVQYQVKNLGILILGIRRLLKENCDLGFSQSTRKFHTRVVNDDTGTKLGLAANIESCSSVTAVFHGLRSELTRYDQV